MHVKHACMHAHIHACMHNIFDEIIIAVLSNIGNRVIENLVVVWIKMTFNDQCMLNMHACMHTCMHACIHACMHNISDEIIIAVLSNISNRVIENLVQCRKFRVLSRQRMRVML